MKLYISTNVDLNLSELPEFFIEPTVNRTTKKLKPKYNNLFAEMWGDFNQVRSLAPKTGYDARCFITSDTFLVNIGITKHLGMYDMIDNDGIMDFYAGVPYKLDKRARKNGFKTNEAWLIVHEICHGLCQKLNRHDSTHAMDDQGRLKELYTELYNELLKTKIGLLQQIVKLATLLLKPKPTLQPLVQRKINAVIEAMDLMGHPIRIVEGYRSFERQNELYAQGRPKGNIVTNARGGESLHQYGVAVDLVFRKEGYKASNELWETLGTVLESQGFSWGGRWVNFQDKPHAELTLGYSLSDFQCGKVDYNKFK